MAKRPILTFFLLGVASCPAAGGEAPVKTDNEGKLPTTAQNVPAPTAPLIKPLGGPHYELNGIKFNEVTRAISFPAVINMAEGLLEYAVVHEAGKVHESLLATAISPYDLNVVLLLLNYQPAATFFDFSDKKAGAVLVKDPVIPTPAQLNVSLEWKSSNGTAQSAPLESLLLNIDKKTTVTSGPFTYTGSFLMEDGTFMARETGSILALYADAASLINNPREGNQHDDIWIPDKTKVPPKDTPVVLTMKPLPLNPGGAEPTPKTTPKAK